MLVTRVAHVVVVWCVIVVAQATGVIDGVRVAASFRLGGGFCVCTQVARLHGCLSLLAGVITRLPLTDTFEHVVQSENVAQLVDHGVIVSNGAIVGGVQDHPT